MEWKYFCCFRIHARNPKKLKTKWEMWRAERAFILKETQQIVLLSVPEQLVLIKMWAHFYSTRNKEEEE